MASTGGIGSNRGSRRVRWGLDLTVDPAGRNGVFDLTGELHGRIGACRATSSLIDLDVSLLVSVCWRGREGLEMSDPATEGRLPGHVTMND